MNNVFSRSMEQIEKPKVSSTGESLLEFVRSKSKSPIQGKRPKNSKSQYKQKREKSKFPVQGKNSKKTWKTQSLQCTEKVKKNVKKSKSPVLGKNQNVHIVFTRRQAFLYSLSSILRRMRWSVRRHLCNLTDAARMWHDWCNVPAILRALLRCYW